ncbi:hypothetical protein JOB18_041461 [Solea senegalensis]|uniref:Secreted protein n=1 Tax=Solea senegalensis TaxID=28829 RepID=A0AAV6SB99_SOLSE|nr:hypothetical protein JOB18_041461 [Solea senegalensis]
MFIVLLVNAFAFDRDNTECDTQVFYFFLIWHCCDNIASDQQLHSTPCSTFAQHCCVLQRRTKEKTKCKASANVTRESTESRDKCRQVTRPRSTEQEESVFNISTHTWSENAEPITQPCHLVEL